MIDELFDSRSAYPTLREPVETKQQVTSEWLRRNRTCARGRGGVDGPAIAFHAAMCEWMPLRSNCTGPFQPIRTGARCSISGFSFTEAQFLGHATTTIPRGPLCDRTPAVRGCACAAGPPDGGCSARVPHFRRTVHLWYFREVSSSCERTARETR